MQRRRFVKNIAAGFAAAPLLSSALAGLDDRLARLAADLAAAPDDASYWRRVRQEFQLQPSLVHLNCGSLGATPRLVSNAVAAYATEIEGNPAAKTFAWGDAQMDQVRAVAAEFLGADIGEVALTRNTTEGMNAVATGLDLEPGDEVLTTNHEHGGGMTCWQYLRKRRGVILSYVELPPRFDPVAVRVHDAIVELFAEKITPRTRIMSFSHIDTITGLKMPVRRIADLAHDRDILVVCDGAQAPGMIDVDVHELGVDAYACSGHKWTLAPKGTGLLYISQAAQERIHPAFLHSGYGGYTASGGTRGVERVLGQGLAMEFQNVIGRDRIERRCRQLRQRVADRLSDVPQLELLTPSRPDASGALLTYALSKGNSGDIRARMAREYNVEIKSTQGTYAYCEEEGLTPANYNAVRFSTHIFNDEIGIDRAMAAFVELARGG